MVQVQYDLLSSGLQDGGCELQGCNAPPLVFLPSIQSRSVDAILRWSNIETTSTSTGPSQTPPPTENKRCYHYLRRALKKWINDRTLTWPRGEVDKTSDPRSETDAASVWSEWGEKTRHVAIFPFSSLLHAITTHPISLYSPRFFITMHAFSTIPSFRFQAVVCRVEIEKCVSLDPVQKRREADENFICTAWKGLRRAMGCFLCLQTTTRIPSMTAGFSGK